MPVDGEIEQADWADPVLRSEMKVQPVWVSANLDHDVTDELCGAEKMAFCKKNVNKQLL